MDKKVFSVTMSELAARGIKDIPQEAATTKHLVYSSPATLAYNSPGAQGFGVKRAGLVIPESVMLLVSPGCCGRNSAIESGEAGYHDRMFYLLMDETDLVTGRHLTKIPQAVREVVAAYKPAPKVVVICITCADALLGTDLERVCRRAEQEVPGVAVVPSYMYALTRESTKPPMVGIRKTIYSLLEPAAKKTNDVNLLGFFSPLDDGCELRDLLVQMGFENINEVSACRTLEEYRKMASASLDLVLFSESNYAAEDLRQRLGTPYAEITRLYQADMIHKQYTLLAAALEREIDDSAMYEAAKEKVKAFKKKFSGCTFSIGQTLNADPFELALALSRYGMRVENVFSNLTESEYPYIRQLAQISPDTRLYVSASPTMVNYEKGHGETEITIGHDAEYYFPNAANVPWNYERQPFGYQGLVKLLDEIETAGRSVRA
jgi:nitrogenase molybdenum-cofactor synthesis protein NifE